MGAPEPLPEAFLERFAGLEELSRRDGPGDVFLRCFGCGPAHPIGLRIRCFKTDTGVICPIIVHHRYEGPPGAVHGGIVAACLDEVLAGAIVRGTGRLSVTGELTIRYVRPVPVETPLLGRAHLIGAGDRHADVEGRIEDLGTAQVLAQARGRFFFVAGAPRPA